MKNVIILHFQPIELYPPIQNFLNFLQQDLQKANILVLTTNPIDKNMPRFRLTASLISIKRVGRSGKNLRSSVRYINYFLYNFKCLFQLIKKKPEKVLCYETLSVFPVYLYKKLFPATQIFIHYHEYTSLREISKSSPYMKWLNHLEKKIFPKAFWISHTNEERLLMFKQDYQEMLFSNLKVLPNYPPSSWYKFRKTKKNNFEKPLKFVYVGALSMDSMYTKEFAEWIKKLNGQAIWDIYSGNYQENVLQYLKELNCPYISFKGGVEYFELVKILNLYDVGVILYNGYIPNHVYSVPNKLFEYHACNLDVWFPKDIKGSLPYITKDTYPKIIAIDFLRLDSIDLKTVIQRDGFSFRQGSFYYEDVLVPLKNKLLEVD